jgi:hypothetical protein
VAEILKKTESYNYIIETENCVLICTEHILSSGRLLTVVVVLIFCCVAFVVAQFIELLYQYIS